MKPVNVHIIIKFQLQDLDIKMIKWQKTGEWQLLYFIEHGHFNSQTGSPQKPKGPVYLNTTYFILSYL